MKVDEGFLDTWWARLEMNEIFEMVPINVYDFEDDDIALDYCDDWWRDLTFKEKRKFFKAHCH